MLVKDYYKIFMGKIIFVDMDNKTTKTAEATFENVCKYENHTIKAIEAGTRTQNRDSDNSVIVEPVICLYIMKEGAENE